ncbi:MAG TPA: Crp/Fnr family transcriptional regulator [Deinococcales bacterium]|nr:Crp/Fnr family transcriptional regulator [Deinococcales bacterium]
MNQYKTLIQSIPYDLAVELASQARVRRVKRGEVVATFGDAPSIAFVAQGWFKLARFTELGDEHVIAVRRRGEFIGLDTLSNPELEMPEVLAMTAGHVIVWPRAVFERFYSENIQFVQAVARILAEQIESEVNQRVMRQSARVSARLARILYLLAADQGERTPSGYRVTLPFTQEELAGLMTVRRETISVNLSELELEGVISRSGRSLLIDPERMTQYLEMNGALHG